MARNGTSCPCKSGGQVAATYDHMEPALRQELKKITEALCQPGKGLIAIDESPKTLGNRFCDLGIENTEETRKAYREMLFCSDTGPLSEYITGVILHDETVKQRNSEGLDFIEFLSQKRLIAGIKVDRGLERLFGSQEEFTTQGLDYLQERCVQYKKEGCHFAKWRCIFNVSDTLPSSLAVKSNATILARYANICQSARLVPILEPEILADGSHSLERSMQVHVKVLSAIIKELNDHNVYMDGVILKLAMVLPGYSARTVDNMRPEAIAEYTQMAIKRTVPPSIPAIMFLSGGETEITAISNLNAINKFASSHPYIYTFCFCRALQTEALKAWNNNPDNINNGARKVLEWAKKCSEASLGKFQIDEELSSSDNERD